MNTQEGTIFYLTDKFISNYFLLSILAYIIQEQQVDSLMRIVMKFAGGGLHIVWLSVTYWVVLTVRDSQ